MKRIDTENGVNTDEEVEEHHDGLRLQDMTYIYRQFLTLGLITFKTEVG